MRPSRWVLFGFLAAEAVLYCAFLTLDLLSPAADTRPLKYGSILLCLLLTLYLARRGGDGLVALGMALTLGADTFLLLLDRWYLLGVLLFFAVQVIYLLRLRPAAWGRGALLGCAALLLLLLPALRLLGQLNVLNAAAALYICVFFFNILQSFTWSSREGRWFTWGLALYFLCDLCVAVHNFPVLFPPALYAFARVGMWLFYLPGQVLIALSAQGAVRHDQAK